MSPVAVLFKFSFLLMGFLLGTSQVQAANRVCVVAFERRIHPISKGLTKIFKHAVDTRLVIEATPKDLYACLEEDFEEILFVSHALQMDETRQNVNLGYFVEKKGEDRKLFIEAMVSALKTEISKEPNRRYQRLLKRYQNLPEDFPLYGAPFLVLGRGMEKAEGIIARKQKAGTLKLKKFRSLTCFRHEIYERYPFYSHLAGYGVELDQAPQSRIMSFLSKRPVTNFNVKWVNESLTNAELSDESESSDLEF